MNTPVGIELRAMMEEVSQATVNKTLSGLGIDAHDPLSAQSDFAKLRALRNLMEDDNFVQDLAFVRRLRLKSQSISETGIQTAVRWLVVGALGLIAVVTRDYWIHHIKG